MRRLNGAIARLTHINPVQRPTIIEAPLTNSGSLERRNLGRHQRRTVWQKLRLSKGLRDWDSRDTKKPA